MKSLARRGAINDLSRMALSYESINDLSLYPTEEARRSPKAH